MPRLGLISASMAKQIMTKGRGKEEFGATFTTLAEQIGAGRIGYDVSTDISHLASVEWGIENEWLAVEAYTERTLSAVTYTGDDQRFAIHPDYDQIGATPDGHIGTDGLIEIKCPNSANHLKNVLRNEQLPDYLPQLQFQLWVTGRKWVDWVSFDPRAPEPIQLHIVRVERDEAMIEALEERCLELHRMADEIAEQLRIILEAKCEP
jgi:hypothetical protein